jgi:N-methylhydantoinase A/oxoprolinase/acetone carboxylase beta subunit
MLYEIATIVISLIAVGVSVLAWIGQRRIQREANDLQRATSKLAEKQLELLLREEKGKSVARLKLDLFRDGKTHRFRLTNVGEADAIDAEFELILKRPEDSPIIATEYAEKFPAKKLMSGSSVTMIAASHLGSPSAFNAVLSWTNPDGRRVEEEAYVSL